MSGPAVTAERHGRKSMALGWGGGGRRLCKRRNRLVEKPAGKDQWLI